MTGTQFNKFIEQTRGKQQAFQAGYGRQEEALIQEAQQKAGQIEALRVQIAESMARINSYETLIRQLEEEAPLALAEVERQTLEVPEEPVLPDEPNREEYPAGDDGDTQYEDAMETYGMALNASVFARTEREAVIEHNEGLLARLATDRATREQTIADRRRRIRSNRDNNVRRQAQIQAIENTFPALDRRVRELAEHTELGASIQSIFASYNRLAQLKEMRRENIEASALVGRQEARRRVYPPPRRPVPGPAVPARVVVDDEKAGEGKGRRAETRGLATLRKNYGFESMSDSDSDSESDSDEDRPFDFDDAGNDMYYSKPMRK
jgi:hypothetical protein